MIKKDGKNVISLNLYLLKIEDIEFFFYFATTKLIDCILFVNLGQR